MSGLKQLRNRVKSVKSTQKITKAMHVVSAAKLKKAKDQVENINDYIDVLRDIMKDISKSDSLADLNKMDQKFFSSEIESMPHLIIMITSDRGLCGSFNSSIIKKVKSDIKNLQNSGRKLRLLIVGNKGVDSFEKNYSSITEQTYHHGNNSVYCISSQIKDKMIELVSNEQIGSADIYYNKFKNAITQISTKDQLFPVSSEDIDQNDSNDKDTSKMCEVSNYEYEGENTIHDTINLYINGQINYALLQSKASEEAARMTAMDNATKNAEDLVENLTLELNRSRQTMITTELTEIISGSEAL